MRSVYDHIQQGALARYIAVAVLVVVILMFAMVLFSAASVASRLAALAVVTLAALSSGLAILAIRHQRVTVTSKQIVVTMGLRFIRRVFPLEQVRNAEPVRNPWYYGWGVRLTPDGWMFNISGFRAVRLTLQTGQRFRIGTDEPEALAAAVHQALGDRAKKR